MNPVDILLVEDSSADRDHALHSVGSITVAAIQAGGMNPASAVARNLTCRDYFEPITQSWGMALVDESVWIDVAA